MKSKGIKLSECPFCGKAESVMFTDAREEEQCQKAVDGDCCCDFEPNGCAMVAVVCSVNKGGCGASSGYATTLSGAAKLWNRRHNAGLVEAYDMLCTMHQRRGGTCGDCPINSGDDDDCYKVFERQVAGA